MSLSVEGQKCPICSGYMFDEDDIVYCPECGAPHHRECFKAIGHCGLEAFHGTEKQYKKSEPAQNSNDAPKEETAKPVDSNVEKQILCQACGKPYSATEEECPHCQTPAPIMFNPLVGGLSIDPLGGVMPHSKLKEGISAVEIANYVAVNTPRYVPKFFKLHQKNKSSWNWGAFLFPYAWFFYRKIYFPGILFFLLYTICSLMGLAVNLSFENLVFENYQQMANYIVQNASTINMVPLLISLVGLLLEIFLRITAALFGDWMYKTSSIERIKKAKEDLDGYDEERLRIRKMGGVNIFLGLLGIMASNWVAYLIFSLL
ncbi:MAG: DUF2628 domain-containing protein [Clostridia bacterium]|nr:DUF2628 domain-containing protein [Clostridia bacterium]